MGAGPHYCKSSTRDTPKVLGNPGLEGFSLSEDSPNKKKRKTSGADSEDCQGDVGGEENEEEVDQLEIKKEAR